MVFLIFRIRWYIASGEDKGFIGVIVTMCIGGDAVFVCFFELVSINMVL